MLRRRRQQWPNNECGSREGRFAEVAEKFCEGALSQWEAAVDVAKTYPLSPVNFWTNWERAILQTPYLDSCSASTAFTIFISIQVAFVAVLSSSSS